MDRYQLFCDLLSPPMAARQRLLTEPRSDALSVSACCSAVAGLAICQTPRHGAGSQRARVIRLRVRVAVETQPRPEVFPRKRFASLIKGTKEENKTLLQSFEQRAVLSRD